MDEHIVNRHCQRLVPSLQWHWSERVLPLLGRARVCSDTPVALQMLRGLGGTCLE